MNNERQSIPTSYIIIGFAVMSLVIIGILVLFYAVNGNQTQQTGEAKQNSYTDKGSGETVDSPEGKSPETYGVNPDQPIYLGFVRLFDVGFSSDQVDALKAAFLDYTAQQKATEKITEISITTATIRQSVDPNTGSTYSFDLTMNQKKKYHAVVASTGISSIKLSLYLEGQATPIFTSSQGNE
jgi:hypothetical protein